MNAITNSLETVMECLLSNQLGCKKEVLYNGISPIDYIISLVINIWLLAASLNGKSKKKLFIFEYKICRKRMRFKQER